MGRYVCFVKTVSSLSACWFRSDFPWCAEVNTAPSGVQPAALLLMMFMDTSATAALTSLLRSHFRWRLKSGILIKGPGPLKFMDYHVAFSGPRVQHEPVLPLEVKRLSLKETPICIWNKKDMSRETFDINKNGSYVSSYSQKWNQDISDLSAVIFCHLDSGSAVNHLALPFNSINLQMMKGT